MANRFVTNGRSVPITHSGTVAAKATLIVDSMFGLAVNGGTNGSLDELYVEGVVEILKGAGVSFAKGAKVYFDNSAGTAKAIAAGYYLIGTAFVAAAGGDATVQVRLNGVALSPAVPDDVVNVVAPLAPNATSRAFHAPATAKTISGIRLRRETALATGTIAAAIKNGAGTTLLSTATIDATALTGSFVAQTLSAVGADLALDAGEVVTVEVVSNNGSATGGPVVAEITFAP